MDDGLFDEPLADKAIRFQNGMVSAATGGSFDGGDPAYKEMRAFFALRADTNRTASKGAPLGWSVQLIPAPTAV